MRKSLKEKLLTRVGYRRTGTNTLDRADEAADWYRLQVRAAIGNFRSWFCGLACAKVSASIRLCHQRPAPAMPGETGSSRSGAKNQDIAELRGIIS